MSDDQTDQQSNEQSTKPPQPTLTGSKVQLVAYQSHHVPTYHQWMQSINLLELTASDRLTIEQEFENLQTWQTDPTKVCYIILDRSRPTDQSNNQSDSQSSDEYVMVGDVNLFMHDWLDPGTAELEVMIADETSRRKGLAQEALTLIMQYAREYFSIHKFMVKIGASNKQSINLFTNQLCFTQVDYSEAFDEVELAGPECKCEQCVDKTV